MTDFSKTYEMAPNPVPAMDWHFYVNRAKEEWNALLNSEAGCDEKNIHRFLAAHPSFVPGAGRGSFPMALISEPPLAGIGRKIPDFVWLASDSLNFSPVLIEIESPCKSWSTQTGVPHHHLTQAVHQLAEWDDWLNRPENVLVFQEHFQVPDYLRRTRRFRPRFVLIYGRRQEFEKRPELNRLRAQFEHDNQEVMTFDRLNPSEQDSIYISATKTRERYQALAVPATFQMSPMIANELSLIEGIPDAVRANDWINQQRKDFLVERLAYWNHWSRTKPQGIINTGDWE
jgi:hypothetical protein